MKELIIWSDAYSVNIQEIDEQHKKLIGLINKLYNLYLERKQDELSAVIKEIKEYTVYHFGTEEKMFRERNYLHRNEHIAMHDNFIKEFNQLVKQFKNSENILTMKAMTFLQRWLTNHILKEDKKYMSVLN